jgi:hypothetical protein
VCPSSLNFELKGALNSLENKGGGGGSNLATNAGDLLGGERYLRMGVASHQFHLPETTIEIFSDC